MIKKKIYSGDNSLAVSKNEEKNINYFWYGFILYAVSYILFITDIYFSASVCQGFQIAGQIIMLFGMINLIRLKIDNKYLEVVYLLYLFYSLTIIPRGIQYDYNSLKTIFLDPDFGILVYVSPLVMLFPRNLGFYRKTFSVILIFGVFFIISVIVFFNILRDPDRLNLVSQGFVETFTGGLALPIGFLLLTYIYHTNKKNIFAFIVMIIGLYFLIYRARRGSIFMFLSTFSFAGMIYLIYTKRKILIIFMSIFLVIMGSFFISDIKTPAMFNFLLDRGDEDTRTGVELDMYADMTSKDWIIGKGINGKYISFSSDNVNDLTGLGYRNVIETGYLQIILKGGIISLGLLLLILIPAVYKGLFNSNNVLSKAAAIWILLWISYLYPTIRIGFSLHVLLVWISVGICYSKKIRNMSDSTIKQNLQYNQ